MTATYRRNPQPYNDGFGTTNVFFAAGEQPAASVARVSWEDDLIMTGVRSFDIKAYDNALATTPTWAGATTCG